MTAAEADQKAAAIMLYHCRAALVDVDAPIDPADWPAVKAALGRIETWLRRRAVGSDKLLVKQMERPTGGTVAMTPKQARKLRIPDGTKPKS